MSHSFKKNQCNFIIKMTKIINDNVDQQSRQKWYDIIDKIAEEKSFNLEKVEKIIEEMLTNNFQESFDNIMAEITNRYNNYENQTSFEDDLKEEHLIKIINEWNQIEEQSKELIGKSTSIVNNVSVLKGDDEASYELIDIDLVEMIDIGLDMEEDEVIFDDYEEKINCKCVFCNSKNVLIISSNEAFCNDCDRNFIINAQLQK